MNNRATAKGSVPEFYDLSMPVPRSHDDDGFGLFHWIWRLLLDIMFFFFLKKFSIMVKANHRKLLDPRCVVRKLAMSRFCVGARTKDCDPVFQIEEKLQLLGILIFFFKFLNLFETEGNCHTATGVELLKLCVLSRPQCIQAISQIGKNPKLLLTDCPCELKI